MTATPITLTITPEGCVQQTPRPLKVLTGSGQVMQVEVTAHASNKQNIVLAFDPDETEAVVRPQPDATTHLAPGQKIVLSLRQDPGIEHRGTFVDLNPQFVRTLSFTTTPHRCGSGDLPDVIIET